MNQKELLQPLLSILAGLLSAFFVFTVFETKTAEIAAVFAFSYLILGEMGDFIDQRNDVENKKDQLILERVAFDWGEKYNENDIICLFFVTFWSISLR